MLIHIAPLCPENRSTWEFLARGYKAFYKTSATAAEYAEAWERLMRRDGLFGLGAFVDGELVGFAHYIIQFGGFIRYDYTL